MDVKDVIENTATVVEIAELKPLERRAICF